MADPLHDDKAVRRAMMLSYLAAAALAGLIFFDVSFSDPAPDLVLRALMVAGLLLYSADVLDTATIATRGHSLRDPDLWVAGLLHGWFLGMVLLMLLWDGVNQIPVTAIGAGIGGLIYGGLMIAGSSRNKGFAAERLYDLDKPVADKASRHLFWRLWPVLAICVIVGIVIWPPDDGWDPAYVLFQMILLPFIVTYYPARPGLPILLNPNTRRICGILLMVIALFLPG